MLSSPRDTVVASPCVMDSRSGWGGADPGVGAAAAVGGLGQQSEDRALRAPGILDPGVTGFEAGFALAELALIDRLVA